MNKQEVVFTKEGDNWFKRNKDALCNIEFDRIINLITNLNIEKINSIIECGCSTGYRLSKLKEVFPTCRMVGFDISNDAIEYGKREYGNIELYTRKISERLDIGKFDLLICNFVLHWVDRDKLAQIIANLDGMVENGGNIVLGDFSPNYNHKNRYKHLPETEIYTYKQDYGKIFESLGTYKCTHKSVFDHNNNYDKIDISNNNSRAVVSVLNKNLYDFYEKNL